MRYGVCVGFDELEKIKSAKEYGYDYVECGFQSFARGSDEDYEKFKNVLNECNIKCESTNCFMPGDLPVTGENVNYDAIAEFVDKGMKRGSECGLKTVVFGSGGARRVPDGFPFEKAVKQLAYFLGEVVSPIAEKYGITVVTEPLRHKETNIINTVSEGVMLAAMVGKDNVKCLADIYHMDVEGDTYDDIRKLKGSILHAHISWPITKGDSKRVYMTDVNQYDYKGFIDALEYAGCERCSIEAACDDFEKEGKIAMDVINALK